MKILLYNELQAPKLKKQLDKTVKLLAAGDFKSAEVKKMPNTGYYRAKLDDANRLLFAFGRYNGETYLLLLEVILNHAYEKSRFLRGAAIDEAQLRPLQAPAPPEADVTPLRYVSPKQGTFHLLDKIICFDPAQQDIYELPTPLVIIGSAGSGKTALTLEKLKMLKGEVAYLSLSPYLVENARNLYYAHDYQNEDQNIDFLTFNEYLRGIQIPQGREISYRAFQQWFVKHVHRTKISEPYRLFEEFKGVLTGSPVHSAFLTRAEYLALGVKQSIFTAAQREEVYDVFEKYLDFLKTEGYYDPNIVSFEYLRQIEARYDFVVIDEVQDITNVQLLLILKSLKKPSNFMMSGDSNQIVHPNFFSWSKVKSLFFEQEMGFEFMRVLHTNYRNSQGVTALSNNLLRIKNLRFGSIDRESTFLIDAASELPGEVLLLPDDKPTKADLNAQTSLSAKYAVLVMNEKDKAQAKAFFQTPLLFSIQEAKGLEYENIILFNFVSGYEKEFSELTRGVQPEDLQEELRYNRAKNKEDKDLEVYKFFVNALYVALTRSVKNIYWVEQQRGHRLFELLGLRESKAQVKLSKQQSNREEWLEEARKLELQGKYEQAQQIRDRLSGIAYLSPEAYRELQEVALDPSKKEREVAKERKELFAYASARKHIHIIAKLAELQYGRAVQMMKDVRKAQKEVHKFVRLNRLHEGKRYIDEYGIDFPLDEQGNSALGVATMFGAVESIRGLLKQGASPLHANADGQRPIHLAFRSAVRNALYQDPQYPACTPAFLAQAVPMLRPPTVKYVFQNRLWSVHDRSMEYFLALLLRSAQDLLLDYKVMNDEREYLAERREFLTKKPSFNYGGTISKSLGELQQYWRAQYKVVDLGTNDFLAFLSLLPDSLVPEFRKKRPYLSSILSQNEVERDFLYNKRLFRRTSHGCYRLNPELVWEDGPGA
jgi:hypothetical protein